MASKTITGYNSSGAAVQVQRGVYVPGISATKAEALANSAAKNSNPIQTRNSQGMTAQEMANYPMVATPPPAAVEYNADGTRKLAPNSLDDYWRSNPIEGDATYQSRMDQIKSDNLSRQQKSIDAINSMYVNILSQAQQSGVEKANQTSVVNSLSGLRGSNIGAANDAKTADANAAHYSGVEAEKAQKVQGIVDAFNSQLQDELQFQDNLRRSDRNSWLSYMQSDMGPDARRKDLADNTRKQMITAGIDPSAVTPDQWKLMSEAAGMDTESFKAIYNAEHTQNQASIVASNEKSRLEREKLKAETAKLSSEAGQNLGGGLKASDLVAKGDRYIASLDEYKKLVAEGYDQYNDFTFLPDHRIFLKSDNSKAYDKKKQTDKKYVVRSGGNDGTKMTEWEAKAEVQRQLETMAGADDATKERYIRTNGFNPIDFDLGD